MAGATKQNCTYVPHVRTHSQHVQQYNYVKVKRWRGVLVKPIGNDRQTDWQWSMIDDWWVMHVFLTWWRSINRDHNIRCGHSLHLLPKDCNIKVMCIWLKLACDQRTPALACVNSWELPETNRMTDPSLRALWVTGQVYRYPRVLLRGLQYNGMDRLLSIKDVVELKLGIW